MKRLFIIFVAVNFLSLGLSYAAGIELFKQKDQQYSSFKNTLKTKGGDCSTQGCIVGHCCHIGDQWICRKSCY